MMPFFCSRAEPAVLSIKAVERPVVNLFLPIERTTIQRVSAPPACFRTLAAILLLLAACSFAKAACTAPPVLQSRLLPKPTAEAYAGIGNWFADQKQFEFAANAFASASRLEPQSASLAYLWGLSLYSAGRDASALAPLSRAKSLDPTDIRPYLTLGSALERMKKNAEADDEWRAALAIDPKSAIALDNLSQDLLQQKDYRSVVELLDKPAHGLPASPVEVLNLGVALAGTARFDDAAVVLRRGLDTYPDSMPIADKLAEVLMFLARVEDAYSVLDQALARHPGDQPTQLLYLRILVTRNSDKASALGQKLLAAYPNHWEVLYLNGLLESHTGDLQQARAHFERSIALNSAYALSHAALGNVLFQLGDLQGARKNLEQAIELGDNQPETELSLGRVFERLGDNARAQEKLRIYQQMMKKQSDLTQAAGLVESGDQAMAAGDSAKAASLYKQALEGDPDEPILFYKLSMALDKVNDIDGEKTALQQAIRLNPDLAEAHNQLGYLALRSGDSAQAESDFRSAIHAAPSYAVAWLNLAVTLTGESKWAAAKQALDRTLALDPQNARARQLQQVLSRAQSGP